MDISKSSSIENIKNADFNIPNKDMKELAEVLASKYFDKDMPYTTKRRILEAVLALKPADHFDQLEKTVLKNTDILFQKSLQFFTTKSNNPTLKRIGMALKSDLAFLEQRDIDFILKEMYGEAASELTNLKQVAAATTGVGILVEYNGKKVL